MTTESMRDTALRLVIDSGKCKSLDEQISVTETALRLAMAEGMERAAAKSERMVNGKGVAAAIRKMKEEL